MVILLITITTKPNPPPIVEDFQEQKYNR